MVQHGATGNGQNLARGCVAYVVVVVDEIVLVSEHLLATTQPALKGYSTMADEGLING